MTDVVCFPAMSKRKNTDFAFAMWGVICIAAGTLLPMIGMELYSAARMADINAKPSQLYEKMVAHNSQRSPEGDQHAAASATIQRRPEPEAQPAAARGVLVLRHAYTIDDRTVSAWTREDDPEAPFYSSLNFLRGGTLHDPAKPFIRADTVPTIKDYTIGAPRDRKHLFEDRIHDGRHWGHGWRGRIKGYTPPGVFAKFATRSGTNPRFDVLMTGWDAVRRATRWGIPMKDVEVWRLVWTTQLQPGDVRYTDQITGGR